MSDHTDHLAQPLGEAPTTALSSAARARKAEILRRSTRALDNRRRGRHAARAAGVCTLSLAAVAGGWAVLHQQPASVTPPIAGAPTNELPKATALPDEEPLINRGGDERLAHNTSHPAVEPRLEHVTFRVIGSQTARAGGHPRTGGVTTTVLDDAALLRLLAESGRNAGIVRTAQGARIVDNSPPPADAEPATDPSSLFPGGLLPGGTVPGSLPAARPYHAADGRADAAPAPDPTRDGNRAGDRRERGGPA